MKILNIKVDWMKDWHNHPVLQVLVDKIPKLDEMVYEERNGIYYAEKDGYAHYLYYTAPGDGFGGSVFDVKMKDGGTRSLKGPWSSRAGCVNAQKFGFIMDVHITDKPDVFERGYTFMAGAITLDLAIEAAKIANCYLFFDGVNEPVFTPSLAGNALVKPNKNGFTRYFLDNSSKDFGKRKDAIEAAEIYPERKNRIFNTTLSGEQTRILDFLK